jgi:PAS domain S-box-containing protein
MTHSRRSRTARYGVAVLSVACALTLKLAFGQTFSQETPFLLLFTAVAVSAWFGGLGPAIVSTLLAALGTDYLFLSLTGNLLALDAFRTIRLSIFVTEGLMLSAFSGALHRQRERTEREAGELRRSRELFRNTFELAGAGIAHVGRDGRFLRVNQRLCTIVGIEREEILSRTLRDLIQSGDGEPELERFRRLMRGEVDRYQVERCFYRSDGSHVWIAVAVTRVADPLEGNDYAIAVVGDVSDWKESQEKIRRLNEDLENRVEERTQELREVNAELRAFTYSIAHDLRAPLTSLQGLAQALVDDYGQEMDAMAREYALRIAAAARRMDMMTQDLLGYSQMHRSEIRLEPVSLDMIVEEALASLTSEIAGRGGAVSVEHPLSTVVGHYATLMQIVVNLVVNALKFVDSARPPAVVIRSEMRAGRVRLWVEDNGIGIAPEHCERIFGVFERLHGGGEYSGTGIGLAIVRRGIERLGGNVGLESEPGAGSRFWIELDVSPTAPAITDGEIPSQSEQSRAACRT